MLIDERRKELNELAQAVEKAKKVIQANKIEDAKVSRVLRVKDIHDLAKIIAQELQTAKDSVIGFAEILPKHTTLRRAFQELKAKNVDIKLLHPKADELAELAKHGVDIKKADHGLEAYIVDGKKLIISLSDLKKEQGEYSFAIWHGAPIIEPLKRHFEQHWSK